MGNHHRSRDSFGTQITVSVLAGSIWIGEDAPNDSLKLTVIEAEDLADALLHAVEELELGET